MLNIQPYFRIDMKREIAIITIAGLWDQALALQYVQEVDRILDELSVHQIFPIVTLKQWSIPSLEILKLINQMNKKVQRHIQYKHSAIIPPRSHQKLFLKVTQQFNHEDTNIETKAFHSFQDAIFWGKSLGYNFDQVADDYSLQLQLRHQNN